METGITKLEEPYIRGPHFRYFLVAISIAFCAAVTVVIGVVFLFEILS